MHELRRLCIAIGALSAVPMATSAAADCTPESGLSTCVDADNLWLRASSTRFWSTDEPGTSGGSSFTASLSTQFILRPLAVVAPSPDPFGRQLPVVRDRFATSLLGSYVPFRRFELSVEAPFVIHQSGSGLSGLSTRGEAELRSTTLRDPRFGAGYSIVEDRDLGVGLEAWLDVSVPLGDERHFAGERGFVVAPSLSGEGRWDFFFVGVLARARLREEVEFAGARFGHQLELAAGLGAELHRATHFSVALEARALPVLTSQRSTTPSGETVDARLIPAEWLLALAAAPWMSSGPRLRLGAGTALPLSGRSVSQNEQEQRQSFAGPTAPALRVLLSAHVAFDPGAASDAAATTSRESR